MAITNDAQIRAVISAEDKASAVLKNFSDNTNRLSASVVAKGVLMADAFENIAKAALNFSIKSAADFEQTRIGLENMLGSADAARDMLTKVSKFAAETPFEFPELAQATRQLVAFGFSGEDAYKTMQQLGDVSAAIGAPINDLAYLMGTLKAQGRAFTIDIRQFAMRGIPIYEYLAKVFNTDTKALNGLIESGQVGFPEVQKAFELMTAEGGKFHGTMEKQSKSLAGLWSTLKDNVGLAAREIIGINQQGDIREGSIFDRLRKSTANLNKELGQIDWSKVSDKAMGGLNAVLDSARRAAEYLLPKLEALINTIKRDFAPAVVDLVKAIGPTVGAGLVWALGVAVDGLKVFLEFITPTLKFLEDNTWIVWTLATAFLAVKTALFIEGAVKAFQASMVLANAAMVETTGVAGLLRGALLLLQSPIWITLGIIGLTVVIGAIYEVEQALKRLKGTWQDMKNQKVPLPNSDIKVSGGSDVGIYAQMRRFFGFASGGYTGQGGTNEIAGVVHKGEYVVPKSQVDQTTGLPKMGGSNINITIQAGAFMGSDVEARKMAQMIFSHLKDAASSKSMSVAQMIG